MVVAIITILTGIFLLQQRQFDSSTLLRSLAYRTALTIREAQTYGASVRFAGSGTQTPAPAYGIYIANASPITQYVLFADYNNNRQYDTSPTPEAVETFTLSRNYTINSFHATTTAGVRHTAGTNINNLTLLFIRPSTDACFATSQSTNACVNGASPPFRYSSAYIEIEAPSGKIRGITITSTGQISVGNPSN